MKNYIRNFFLISLSVLVVLANQANSAGSFHGKYLGDGTVPLTKISSVPANTIVGNNTGSAAVPTAMSVAQAKTLLGVNGLVEDALVDGVLDKAASQNTVYDALGLYTKRDGSASITGDWSFGGNDITDVATLNGKYINNQMSIDNDSSGFKLVNDSASPGNNKVYGTDGSGVKGWIASSSGGPSLSGSNTWTGVNSFNNDMYTKFIVTSGNITAWLNAASPVIIGQNSNGSAIPSTGVNTAYFNSALNLQNASGSGNYTSISLAPRWPGIAGPSSADTVIGSSYVGPNQTNFWVRLANGANSNNEALKIESNGDAYFSNSVQSYNFETYGGIQFPSFFRTTNTVSPQPTNEWVATSALQAVFSNTSASGQYAAIGFSPKNDGNASLGTIAVESAGVPYSSNFAFRLNNGNSTNIKPLEMTYQGNIGINGNSYGSGQKVIFIGDGTAPSGNPTGGGILYSEGGALKWRSPGGTVTVIAPN